MRKLTSLLLFLVASFASEAQQLDVLKDGVLQGEFTYEGSSQGLTIETKISNNNLNISFSDKESWGRIFLNLPDSVNLAERKFMSFKIRTDTTLYLEEIGCGRLAYKGERIRKIHLDNNWQTVIMELPSYMDSVKVPFVMASVAKVNVEIEYIKFTSEQPAETENTLLLVSSEYERLPNAKYVYSESSEFGALSGYAGENNGSSMTIDDHCMENPYRGKYCIKISVDDSEDWRMIFLQASGRWTSTLPENTQLESLKKYKKLVFYARTPEKNYFIPTVTFGDYTTMFEQEDRSLLYLKITSEWKRFELDIRGLDRNSVNDVLNMDLNEGVVYLDEIRFE